MHSDEEQSSTGTRQARQRGEEKDHPRREGAETRSTSGSPAEEVGEVVFLPKPTCHRFKNIEEGTRFGKLVVLGYVGQSEDHNAKWACLCDCGKTHIVARSGLIHSKTKSCGCTAVEKHIVHGYYGTLTYSSWSSMRTRCENPKHVAFWKYGGSGITVCDRWLDFRNFLADMGERPAREYSIDRWPDNRGNYEPGNCRWATKKQQSNNREDNVLLEFQGEIKTVSEWARESNFTGVSTLRERLKRGWSVEEAMTIPVWKHLNKWRLASTTAGSQPPGCQSKTAATIL